MQKSKGLTIGLTILIAIFFIINKMYWVKYSFLYLYLINPISFISIAIIIKMLISTQFNMHKYRKDIVQYVVVTSLIYILLYFISGLFSGFGNNPYNTTFKGIILNFLSNIPVIICLEYIRYKLIHNVLKKDKTLMFILLVITFSIWDVNFSGLLRSKIVPYIIFSFVFYNLIPIVIENILFTYIADKCDYIPNVFYRFIYRLAIWTSPILPQLPWVFETILSTILPLFLLLYTRYFVNSKDKMYSNFTYQNENPDGLIPFTIALVVVIWFTLGAFPIKPVGVATASMYPNINVGDMVVLNKIDLNDLKENDIIGYKLDNITVVHRVKYISKNSDGKFTIITKGDNNKLQDYLPVGEEQVIGKVIFKVKYIAMPTVWLHSLYSGRQDVAVETGV